MKLVLFDCDGTLIDSIGIIHETMRRTFQAFGKRDPHVDETKAIMGLTLDIAIARIDGKPHVDDEASAMTQHYKSLFGKVRDAHNREFGEPMFDGIRACLDALKARDVFMGVVTGKSNRGLDYAIAQNRLEGYFLVRRTADDCPSKPHPAMVHECCDEMGVRPQETVVIGDAVFDMQMAKAAGAKAIGVNWGYAQKHALLAHGADSVADNPADLMDLIFSGSPTQ